MVEKCAKKEKEDYAVCSRKRGDVVEVQECFVGEENEDHYAEEGERDFSFYCFTFNREVRYDCSYTDNE